VEVVHQLDNIAVAVVSLVQSGVAAVDIVCVVDNPAEDIAVVVGLIVEVVANLVDTDIEVDRLAVAAWVALLSQYSAIAINRGYCVTTIAQEILM